MLLAGGQVHLVLVVIHADVDNVRQQLLVAWDHFQLLMETLHSSAPLWLAPLLPPPHPLHCGIDGVCSCTRPSPPTANHQGRGPASSQCPPMAGRSSCTFPTAQNWLPSGPSILFPRSLMVGKDFLGLNRNAVQLHSEGLQ